MEVVLVYGEEKVRSLESNRNNQLNSSLFSTNPDKKLLSQHLGQLDQKKCNSSENQNYIKRVFYQEANFPLAKMTLR